MKKKLILFSIIFVAVAGFITLSAALYQTFKITGGSFAEGRIAEKSGNVPIGSPGSRKSNGPIQLTILGDSIAKGTGDEKGKGFSEYLPDYYKNLASNGISVENSAINGLQSSGLLDQLKSGSLSPSLSKSDIILISIGGNDVLSLNPIGGILAKADMFKDMQGKYLSNLKEILKTIRKDNNHAAIIFVGLYNPYENQSTQLLNIWNYDTRKVVEGDGRAVFIPTSDLINSNLKQYISPDGLHPSSAGYQAISNRIAKSVESIFNTGL